MTAVTRASLPSYASGIVLVGGGATLALCPTATDSNGDLLNPNGWNATTIGNLLAGGSGEPTFTAGAIGIDTRYGNFTYGAVIQDTTGGSLGLVKNGAYTLTLTPPSATTPTAAAPPSTAAR